MTKPFSWAFKRKMVERLTGKDAISARQLAQTMGLKQQTLSRWLEEAHSLPVMPIPKKGKHQHYRSVLVSGILDRSGLGRCVIVREHSQSSMIT